MLEFSSSNNYFYHIRYIENVYICINKCLNNDRGYRYRNSADEYLVDSHYCWIHSFADYRNRQFVKCMKNNLFVIFFLYTSSLLFIYFLLINLINFYLHGVYVQ